MSRTAKNRKVTEDQRIAAALRKGKNDVRNGRTKCHAEVEKIVEAWLGK